jgi:nucleotide-binding universal stress UspA family protein
MFQKILFATTASPACDDAARLAFELARRYDAELCLFHVTGVPTRAYSQLVVDVKSGEEVSVDDEYLELVEDEIRGYYARQIAGWARHKIEIATGMPHREILRSARKNDVDLVIMGSSTREAGEPNFRKGFTGSTLQRVAKAARCPVLTMTRSAASYWGGISNVVFGTDFSKAADSAFQFAAKVARAVNGELHIFHALDISSIHAGKSVPQDEIDDMIIAAREKMRSKYVSKIKDFTNWALEVWEGVPYVEIVKFARERQADLIVMAHHTREPDPDLASLGSTVEQVILRANCPVASVNHPDKL